MFDTDCLDVANINICLKMSLFMILFYIILNFKLEKRHREQLIKLAVDTLGFLFCTFLPVLISTLPILNCWDFSAAHIHSF